MICRPLVYTFLHRHYPKFPHSPSYNLYEVLITCHHHEIPLHGLCSNPEIVFIDLQHLTSHAVCPSLYPPRYTTPEVHALYGYTRLYMGESHSRIPSYLSQRMVFSPFDTCLDVCHRLTRFLRQSQTVAQFANRYRRDQLRSVAIETRDCFSHR